MAISPYIAAVVLLASLLAWARSRQRNNELFRVVEAFERGELSTRVRAPYLDIVGRGLNALGVEIEHLGAAKYVENSRLSAVLNAMVEAVFVTDARGDITLANRALNELLGAEAKGRSAMEAIRSPELLAAIAEAGEGENTHAEFEMIDVQGGSRAFEAEVAALDERGSVVVVLHEVTAAVQADRVRRDFVANASHELRTPLTAIRGYAETLRDGAHRDVDSSERFLDVILKHTKRLEALVGDLSVLSQAESKQQPMEITSLNVLPLVEEVVRGLESKAHTKNQTIRIEQVGSNDTAIANARALDQVMLNLVDNAIKYAPDSGKIAVRVVDESGPLRIEVENTGPGIPNRHLGRIFERFYRVDDSRSRELGGTGLGLAIVKHLVASMNGNVEVKSETDQTTFTVSLPSSFRSETGTRLSQS